MGADAPAPVPDLGTPRRIDLVGIGGAGISAIALILAAMGHEVSGADVTETAVWPRLLAAGIRPRVVPADALFELPSELGAVEVVAHSTAFPPGPEVVAAAAAAGRVLVNRAGILGAICRTRRTVAISGTHGKTSTTAMLATLLRGAGADPSYLVGATVVSLGEAARWGGPAGAFVVEADESDGSFLELGARIAVVTNIDEDHLDHWGSIDAIEAAFDRFVAAAERAVVCLDDPRAEGSIDERAARVAAAHGAVTVAEHDSADWHVHGVVVDRLTTTFGLRHHGVEVGPVSIGTPGRHHARNAAVAIAVAHELGVDRAAAVTALGAYQGVARRFEVVGVAGGVTVVDDYAHNPGKVRALVASAGEAGWSRVVVVFQPHRFTRTRDQGADFGAALAPADLIAVTEVYGAGEAPLPGVSGVSIVDAVHRARPDAEAQWLPTLDDAEAWLRTVLEPGDLCLTVGAGDVWRLGPRLVEGLRVDEDRDR